MTLERLPAETPTEYAEFLAWALAWPRPEPDSRLARAYSWHERAADWEAATSRKLLELVARREAVKYAAKSLTAPGGTPTITSRELLSIVSFLHGDDPKDPPKKEDLSGFSEAELIEYERLMRKAAAKK